MAEFVGSHRSQQVRQRDAELNVRLFYPIKENIAVLASSILSQKGHTESQVGRSFPGGRDLQHKVIVARNTTTEVGDRNSREQSTQTISIPACSNSICAPESCAARAKDQICRSSRSRCSLSLWKGPGMLSRARSCATGAFV